MAQIQNHGPELYRYFSTSRRALVSVCADGVNLYRTPWHGWRILSRKKKDVSLSQWTEGKRKLVEGLKPWQRSVKSLPSLATLERWGNDCMCETVTGDEVEPDGVGPDGSPSWLLVLGMI